MVIICLVTVRTKEETTKMFVPLTPTKSSRDAVNMVTLSEHVDTWRLECDILAVVRWNLSLSSLQRTGQCCNYWVGGPLRKFECE